MNSPKKILFVSHDPGGFNLLIPAIQFFSEDVDFEVHLLLAGAALKKYSTLMLDENFLHLIETFPCDNFPNEYDVNKSDVENVIQKISPDIIFTGTSINSNIERYCIRYGNETGITTLSYIDSWIGEDVRFTNNILVAYPSIILVCDKAMEGLYQKFITDNCSLAVVGNAHLEKLHLQSKQLKDLESVVDSQRVLFFSENLFHYYRDEKMNEMQIIQQILQAYSGISKITISIRPHPLESKEHWYNFLGKNKSTNSLISLELDNTCDVKTSIRRSAMTFGISSMALIESSLIGVYTFSYQVGIHDDKNMLYIPFEEYGIEQIAEITDVCSVLENVGKNSCRQPNPHSFTNSLQNIKKIIYNNIFE